LGFGDEGGSGFFGIGVLLDEGFGSIDGEGFVGAIDAFLFG
jgi:hypothetical protein